MKNIKMTRNPFLLFLPFLILFITIALIFPTHGNDNDEARYLMFAQNMLHGFYSPPAPNIDLGNSPGYSIILMPFIALSLPLISITILNAFFYYLSIVFLFKTLEQLVSFRIALIFSLFWGFYYNGYQNVYLIISETFTSFLVCFFIFNLFRALATKNRGKTKIYIYLSGLTIGYIILTKVIFGYVVLLMLVASFFLWILNRSSDYYKKGLFILFIGMATTIPYLAYTYHLTGKIFYWSSFSGENLYWMASPYEGEYGSWIKYPADSQSKTTFFAGGKELIELHHEKDFEEIAKYRGMKRDDVLMRISIENIKSHPVKYIQNCISNAGRILFNYPYTYTLEKSTTLLRMPLTGIIVVLGLFCIFPTLKNWRKINYPLRFLLFFILLYLGASVFACAETRMFTVAVPILLLWISYILQKTITIKIKLDNESV